MTKKYQRKNSKNLSVMSIRQFVLVLFSFLASVLPINGMLDISWWSSVAQLSTQLNLPPYYESSKETSVIDSKRQSLVQPPECVQLKGLSPGQKRICELFKDHMHAVGNGAKQAISECEWQFRYHRWNCSTPHELKGHIGPVHKKGTREAAFTYAILSAGVTHEIGRHCRLGFLRSCGCSGSEPTTQNNSPQQKSGVNEDWTWSGCGDNIDYGYRFSRDFIDVREKEENNKRSAEGHGRSLMNRWNNEVGRKIVKRHTKPKCKCHGVSGSCNLKTCWMQLPTIRHIGNVLQTKYRQARRIQINSRGNMQFDKPSLYASDISRGGQQQRGKTREQMDLVFLDSSPDYCHIDRTDGTIGTQGRICTDNPNAPNSCDLLCCGRGYESHIEETMSKCNCKFQWCCQVICDICRNVTQVFTCK